MINGVVYSNTIQSIRRCIVEIGIAIQGRLQNESFSFCGLAYWCHVVNIPSNHCMVTGISSNHYDEAICMIASALASAGSSLLYVIDVGLTEHQATYF